MIANNILGNLQPGSSKRYADAGGVTMETGWKEADGVTALQHFVRQFFQGQEEHALDLSTEITCFIN